MAAWLRAIESAGLVYWWEVTAIRRGNGMVRLGGQIRSQHTPILVLRKGPHGPPTDNPLIDLIESVAPEEEAFWWQQPVSEALHLIRSLSRPGDLIGDHCAGTGRVGVASVLAGEGRRFVGCEADERGGPGSPIIGCSRPCPQPVSPVRYLAGATPGPTPLQRARPRRGRT